MRPALGLLPAAFALGLAACAPGASSSTPASSAPSASAAPTTGTARAADGNAIFYRTAGAGEPAVVLVHCWGCSSDEWADVIPVLAASHRVVALDLPGHGRSGKTRAAWTVDAYAADVRAVMDALGIQKAALVGHSMSGSIIVAAAAAMPDRVTKLVPIDTLLDVTRVEDPAENAKFFADLRADFGGTLEKFLPQILPKDVDPAVLARIVAFEKTNDPAIAVPIIQANFAYDVKAPLARVKAPIVAINGDVFPTNLAGNRTIAPQFDAHVMNDTGHWPMLEHPQAFAALLAEVLADK